MTGYRVAERAVAAAGTDNHHLQAGGELVEDAVAREVGRNWGRRSNDVVPGVRGRRNEAGRESVFQDFELGPMHSYSQRAASHVVALARARRQGGAEVVQ